MCCIVFADRLTSTVEVTARYGGQPISGVEIILRHHPWPHGKLITKGKTGANGRVKLSGNFTDRENLCVGGTYASHEKALCKQPFPKAVTLNF